MNRLNRLEVEKLDLDFFPENYTGTEKQNRYFSKVMDEIGRYAKAQKTDRGLEAMISRFIEQGIMAQAFAEGPLNTLCPGFEFKKTLTMSERLAGVTR
jgi:hypothetical protein